MSLPTTDVAARPGDRYDMDRQDRRAGNAWGYVYYCVPQDSETGRAALAALRRQRDQLRADKAVEAWQKDRTPESRAAAIAALQAIDEEN